jgi:hypothetical protein
MFSLLSCSFEEKGGWAPHEKISDIDLELHGSRKRNESIYLCIIQVVEGSSETGALR